VKVFGKPVEKYKSTELFGGTLAMLPQDPKSLFVKKTVREDLEEMTKDKALIAQTASTCQIETLLESHPYDLSGGEQQRAALAKVLLTQPKLLLLDEPTKGIDSFFKETFAEILKELKARGITIVMVSHDVEFCARYADLVSMFFDGQILTTDHPRRFFGNNSFYTTAANRMSRHVFSMAVTAEDVIDLYRQNKEG
jgi:energy-coupling factor transport system ATP-binding protein